MLNGIYSVINLPETTRDTSLMKNQQFNLIIKRRTDSAIKKGKQRYFMLMKGEKGYEYLTSLYAVKDKENVFDFDIRSSQSISGVHEFYRAHFNFDKGIVDVTFKSPVL